jgi:hypothetical protein
LVEVPISVTVPPSTVANDMGMSNFLGLMPHLGAHAAAAAA